MPKDTAPNALHSAYDGDELHDVVEPEKSLLLAVLVSAIADVKQTGDLGRKATAFFLNDDDGYLFSFQTICDYLELEPRRILLYLGLKEFK